MKQTTIAIVIGAVTAVVVGAIYVTLWPGYGPGTMPMMDHTSAGVTPMNTESMGMMHGEAMLVTSERAFIEHMVPHHQEAIDTAKEVLERGGSTPEMVLLAETIISSQTAEVADMKAWYEAWYGETYEDNGEYEPMMRDLAPYSGAELDAIFLHDMTMHHMGAIMMARSVEPYIEHEEVQDLTDAIIVNQSAEIRTMQEIFAELPE